MRINNRHTLHNITQNNDTESLDKVSKGANPITEPKIRPVINKLKSDCHGGPDGTRIEMFKAVIDDNISFLTLILMAYMIKDFFLKIEQ